MRSNSSDNKINTGKNDFIRLLTANQRRIQAFILVLVPNVHDADDLYQETASEMWDRFDSFTHGTDFVAWAVTIAKFKVLNFYRDNRKSRLHFDSEICENLASTVSNRIETLDDNIDILKNCVRKLSSNENNMLKLRYNEELTFKQISLRVGKTPPAIHRIISNIHSKLAICLRRSLRLGEMK